ncbi:probable carboxylesterase 5 [Andrographis paniculata]|uniref:probable carboxylesterase 5 n=1 Tax=Andrographis paniculata TaxID=175694 RepID=UPI0021E7F679|nr:probable carboxylesterase 5 [Andrographis paniculata]
MAANLSTLSPPATGAAALSSSHHVKAMAATFLPPKTIKGRFPATAAPLSRRSSPVMRPFAITTQEAAAKEVLHNVAPFIVTYKDGSFERPSQVVFLPPSTDPVTGVESKDVVIHPENKVTARIFLPPNAKPGSKLPLFFYAHGGAFVSESPFSHTYHSYVNSVVKEANAVGVSIDYRLAPEAILPAAYDDTWHALEWVFSHGPGGNGTEPWLRDYVDFNKVSISGDSAGGNIAYNMAVRAGEEPSSKVKLDGVILNCPHFWGNEPLPFEAANKAYADYMGLIWLVAWPDCPGGWDHPASNPTKNPNLHKLGCKRIYIYVAGNDILRERGLEFVDSLKKVRWPGQVYLSDVPGVNHVFNVSNHTLPESKEIMKKVVAFLHGEKLD